MQTLPPVGVSGGTLLRHRAKMIWSFRCQLLRGAVISTTVTNILKRRVFTLYSYLQNTRTPVPSSHLDNSLMECSPRLSQATSLVTHTRCQSFAQPYLPRPITSVSPVNQCHPTAHAASTRRRYGPTGFMFALL